MESNIDKYSHRLSIKNNICYESAREVMEKSLARLENKNVSTNDIVRSAYKYSRKKMDDKLTGGDQEYYKQKYLKYKKKYLDFKKNNYN